MATDLERYYAQRAHEYDRVYDGPERQADLRALEAEVVGHLAGRRVLDVAAGTGYWTARFVDAAHEVTATDVNDSTLEVARGRRSWPASTRFVTGDAFRLDGVPGSFDAAFVGFFWSHLPRRRLDGFLEGLVGRLEPASTVLLVDNRYVEGSNHPVTRVDHHGDTYQRRRLADGTQWEVRKNFPGPDEVASVLSRHGTDVDVRPLTYFWSASVTTPAR